jgi:undecaprenyl-diphosphatase
VSTLEAILLGIVQGITEFLPVSSSGHLALFQMAMGLGEMKENLLFDTILHLGTLLAIFCVFGSQIKQIIAHQRSTIVKVCIATLPLFPLTLAIKSIDAVMGDHRFLPIGFLISAALLFLGESARFQRPAASKTLWKDPLVIGLFQAAAILPSISRSGSTISAARLLGWSRQEAILFSFLMAIPAILGAVVFETGRTVWKGQSLFTDTAIGWPQYLIGFLVSFLIGIAALQLLKKLATSGSFRPFAWYCLAVSIVSGMLLLI